MTGTMSTLVHEAARRFGERVAVTMLGEGGSATFEQVEERAGRYAGGLARLGIGRGDRVVLNLPNGIDWMVAYHAIARLGAVVVPANFLLTASEVAFIAENSEAQAIILPGGREAAITATLSEAGVELVRILHGEGGSGDATSEHLLDAPWLAPVDVAPDDLFTIGYTSGTTGRPKGAMQTHRAVFGSTAMTATIHVRHSEDRILTALPFPHVYGNVVMNTAFLTGLELKVMARFDPGKALAAIGREKITLFEGVPSMYYQMLAHEVMASAEFASLTRCTTGGQTMPVAKIDEVVDRFGCPLLELWGMTELSGPATTHSPYWPSRHGSIGLPFPQTEVRIADLDEPASDAPAGIAGELCVRGPLVTIGYWKNPEATAASIDVDGWLATGDVGVRDEDGYLRIVDRRKDLIITAGYNIYPAELEQVVAKHPAVAMVAVAAVADAEKGELATAFVVLRPDTACDAETLSIHCRQHLAAYKVPRAFVFVDDLPKTSTGKILRRALRDSYSSHLPRA
jgi:long-chain acyl-CoA synthetase